jgi:hypothetical protein
VREGSLGERGGRGSVCVCVGRFCESGQAVAGVAGVQKMAGRQSVRELSVSECFVSLMKPPAPYTSF